MVSSNFMYLFYQQSLILPMSDQVDVHQDCCLGIHYETEVSTPMMPMQCGDDTSYSRFRRKVCSLYIAHV